MNVNVDGNLGLYEHYNKRVEEGERKDVKANNPLCG